MTLLLLLLTWLSSSLLVIEELDVEPELSTISLISSSSSSFDDGLFFLSGVGVGLSINSLNGIVLLSGVEGVLMLSSSSSRDDIFCLSSESDITLIPNPVILIGLE